MYNYIVIIIILLLLFYYISFKKKEGFENNNQKIAVIICGFAPRSFKYTYKYIDKNIIQHLKKNNFNVDVFHHSLLSKKNRVESTRDGEENLPINNDDVYLLKAKIETEYQEDIHLPNNKVNCWTQNEVFTNACRGIYSEYKAFNLINPNNYESSILITSDSLFLKPISIEEVKDTIKNKNIIYTTPYNKSCGRGECGRANGFYISHPSILKKITSRFFDIENFCEVNKSLINQDLNSEFFLKTVLDNNNIINKDSNMFYLKIRANKKSNHYIKLIDQYNIENADEIKKLYS